MVQIGIFCYLQLTATNRNRAVGFSTYEIVISHFLKGGTEITFYWFLNKS